MTNTKKYRVPTTRLERCIMLAVQMYNEHVGVEVGIDDRGYFAVAIHEGDELGEAEHGGTADAALRDLERSLEKRIEARILADQAVIRATSLKAVEHP